MRGLPISPVLHIVLFSSTFDCFLQARFLTPTARLGSRLNKYVVSHKSQQHLAVEQVHHSLPKHTLYHHTFAPGELVHGRNVTVKTPLVTEMFIVGFETS